MSDIQVTSDASLDDTQFLAALARMNQALDQFAQFAGNLRPAIEVDQTKWQASLTQMQQSAQQQLSSLPIKLDLAPAQQQLNAWFATIQNMPLHFTFPNAAMIGQSIGNAAAAAFMAGVSFPAGAGGGGGGGMGGGGTFGTWNPATQSYVPLAYDPAARQFINPENGMGMAGINWPSSGGGGRGGGGRGNIGGLPIGRGFTAMMMLHNIVEWNEVESRYESLAANANGDPVKITEAEIYHRTGHDSAMYGLGRVGRFIRENGYDALTGADTVSDLQGTLSLQKQQQRDLIASRRSNLFDRQTNERLELAHAPNNRARADIQARHEHDARMRKIKEEADERVKKAQVEYDEQIHHADKVEDEWAHYEIGKTNAEVAAELRVKAKNEFDAKLDQINASGGWREAGYNKENQAFNLEENRRKESQVLEDLQAPERLRAAKARAAGDSPEAERIELKLRLEKEQLQAKQSSDIEGKSFAKERPYLEQAGIGRIESGVAMQAFHARQDQQDIIEGAHFATMRTSGQSRLADQQEYIRGLQKEVDLQKQAAEGSTKAAEKVDALTKAALLSATMGSKIAAHEAGPAAEAAYASFMSGARITSLETGANVATLRASGNERGASRAEAQAQINQQALQLLMQFGAMSVSNQPGADSLLNQAAAVRRTGQQRIDAMDKAYARQDEIEVSDLHNHAKEMRLRANGNNYEADLLQTNTYYDKKVDSARAAGQPQSVIDAIEDDRKAQHEQHAVAHSRSIEDMREQTSERSLRRRHQDGVADLMRIHSAAQHKLRDAGGDAAAQRAILEEERESVLDWQQSQIQHPTDLRSAWEMALGGAASAGSRNGRRARDAARTLLDNIKTNLGNVVDNPIADPMKGQIFPDGLNPDADTSIGASGGLNEALAAFQDSTKKWSDIADKINNGPTLVTATFS